jgi:hypothetical protein
LDSTILENIPMESNHQLNRNITLSDVQCPLITGWWTIAVVASMFAKHCDFHLHVAKAVLSESK